MIILDLNEDDLNKRLELGEVLHLKVEAIKAIWPGRYRLVLQDVSPLPGAEPTSYACHFCGLIGEALPDGSLPDGWAVKTFEKGAHIVCPECGDARICRVCGCSDDQACETAEGRCLWVEEDLCSACR